MPKLSRRGSSSNAVQEIKILHCAETIKGGIATYLDALVPIQLADAIFAEVHVLVPESQINSLEVMDRLHISTYRDCSSRILNSFILAANVIRLLQKKSFNIIHIHSTFAGLIIRPLIFILPFYSIKVIYCPHGWAWDRNISIFSQKIIVLIERLLTFFTHKIVCISRHEHISALDNKLPASKLALIRNGIKIETLPCEESPTAMLPLWPDNVLRLLFVGRLDYQKGFDVLHSAVIDLGGKVFLKVAGDIVTRDYKLPVKSLENVEYLGWQSKSLLSALYSTADILVIPSRWEGFGLVALEAMKNKLPIIASSVGGLQELVDDLSTGILIEPNSATILASAINKISAMDRKPLGERGYQKLIEEFSIDRVHTEMLSLYRDILGLSISNT